MDQKRRAMLVGALMLVILLAMNEADAADCGTRSNIKDLRLIVVNVPKPTVIAKP